LQGVRRCQLLAYAKTHFLTVTIVSGGETSEEGRTTTDAIYIERELDKSSDLQHRFLFVSVPLLLS
jgi:hypothetical protein